jgi:hypothetical protein
MNPKTSKPLIAKCLDRIAAKGALLPTRLANIWIVTGGVPVIPLDWESKRPLRKDWPNRLIWDPAEFERVAQFWKGEHGKYIMPGIPTGSVSGLCIVDFDEKEDPNALDNWPGDLPDTAWVKTPGGWHALFIGSGLGSVVGALPGIDTRGEGGYIVAPGSLRADGGVYRVTDPKAPADLPDLSFLGSTKKVRGRGVEAPEFLGEPYDIRSWRVLEEADDAISGAEMGNRHFTVFRHACEIGRWVAAGLISREKAEKVLTRAAGEVHKDRSYTGEMAERDVLDGIDYGIAGFPAPEIAEINRRYSQVACDGRMSREGAILDPLILDLETGKVQRFSTNLPMMGEEVEHRYLDTAKGEEIVEPIPAGWLWLQSRYSRTAAIQVRHRIGSGRIW